MVKKLFKHEFLAWLRIMPIIYGITLVIAAMLRIIVIFENDSTYYGIVFGSAIFMFVVALIATIAASTVFSIRRFYKNMFTGEGYLTHTLPVTPANHLWVKVITAVSFNVASLLVCLLAGIIATAGEVFAEICNAAAYLLKEIPQDYVGHLAGWVSEYIVLLLVAMLNSHLFFYVCICIGQLFRKNRALAAVGVYFGFYMVSQILSTVVTAEFYKIVETAQWEKLLEWVTNNPETTIHIVLCGMIVLVSLVSLIYFVICHRIIRKKLNLE